MSKTQINWQMLQLPWNLCLYARSAAAGAGDMLKFCGVGGVGAWPPQSSEGEFIELSYVLCGLKCIELLSCSSIFVSFSVNVSLDYIQIKNFR